LILGAESELFGSTDAEVVGWVLEGWHLPWHFIEPIRHHHEPSMAEERPAATVVLRFSDVLARARGSGSGADALVPTVDETVWAEMNPSKAEINAILWESEQLIREDHGFLF
jgi:HD-like signal output (HDOD) protein